MNSPARITGKLIAVLFLAMPGSAWPASAYAPMKTLPRDAAVRFDETLKTVTRIEGRNLLDELPDEARRAQTDPGAAALAFVSAYRESFRLIDPATELRLAPVKGDELGFHHVRLAQVFRGIEVADGEMLFHFNRDAALYLVTAHYFPTPELPERKPKLNAAAAIRAAAAALSAKPGAWPVALKIWLGPRAVAKLAYEVTALDRGWRLFVDAISGQILDRIPTNSSDATASQRPIAPNP